MKNHYRHENDCLNCGTTLEGKFCHNCGQENLEIKESFGHTMVHAIGDYFHFDEKFLHTLWPLLFRPGYLTNEYLSGKRVQYLHPVRMYIFISLIYFLVYFKTGHEIVSLNPGKTANTEQGLKASHKKNNHKTEKPKPAQTENSSVNFGASTSPANGNSYTYKPDDSTLAAYNLKQSKLPEDRKDNIFIQTLNRKYFDYHKKYGDSAQDVFLEDLQHNIPKMMFLLLPILALILKLAFSKNKKFYVEHLIFTFHLHCFAFLFLTFLMLAQIILPITKEINDWVELVAAVYITWYIYRSLKVMYKRSVFRTFTKMIGMTFIYSLAFIFCVVLVLAFTTLTF